MINELKIITKNKEETINLAIKISKYLFPGSLILLDGDLGAGKTTFTQGIGKGLGIKEEINSPTFNICKCYFNKPLSLFHIDAYRLEDVPSENKNIGLEELIEGNDVCIVEWPIFIKEMVEYVPSLKINITLNEDNSRTFNISSDSIKYNEIFEVIKNV